MSRSDEATPAHRPRTDVVARASDSVPRTSFADLHAKALCGAAFDRPPTPGSAPLERADPRGEVRAAPTPRRVAGRPGIDTAPAPVARRGSVGTPDTAPVAGDGSPPSTGLAPDTAPLARHHRRTGASTDGGITAPRRAASDSGGVAAPPG